MGQHRTTPACAGRTPTSRPGPRSWTDHPRLRGENVTQDVFTSSDLGPPPPARGEPETVVLEDGVDRTTPACAGRTRRRLSGRGGRSDHPRLRGENPSARPSAGPAAGPPPPARGERSWCGVLPEDRRTTPACAGRTRAKQAARAERKDHPRLRGENNGVFIEDYINDGPPPPARGEQRALRPRVVHERTTPACAGRTGICLLLHGAVSDHPRLRGENGRNSSSPPRTHGPPPPARGEPRGGTGAGAGGRTTPACAGRTVTTTSPRPWRADHPRLRGENTGVWITVESHVGPPPPARGEPSTPS